MEILRITTAGSVDDGKSTLIGRLLYDSKSIFKDQLAAIEQTSKKKGLDEIDFSLLTDGPAASKYAICPVCGGRGKINIMHSIFLDGFV